MRTPREIYCQECGYEGEAKAPQVGAYILLLVLSLFVSMVLFVVFPPIVFVTLFLAIFMGFMIFTSRGKHVCHQCGSANIRDKESGS